MSHSNDSQRPRRTRPQFTAVVLALLAGAWWAQQVSAADPHSGGFAASGTVGGGPILALTIDPGTPTTLYAGTQCSGVLKSLDGGDSWSAVNTGLADRYINALAINPATPATLYAGSWYGGVYRSLNGGSSWSAVNTGLGSTTVLTLAINPVTPTTVYAGIYNGGVYRSLNGGGSWGDGNLWPRSVSALAIDPTTPTTVYADGSGVFKSTDGAVSWQAVDFPGLPVFDPATPTTLYAAGAGGVFKSRDAGGSWRAVNTGLTNTFVRALAIDPTTPTTLYAGTDGGVFKSVNGANSWSAVNTGLTDTSVIALVINPTTPAILSAGTGTGVFRSVNGGSSWQATGLVVDAICGDGVAGCGEQCDDGNTVDGDGCDATCRREFCGDAIVQDGLGEECDDGNRNPVDGCTNDCTVCGDGVVTPPEECEGGNTSSGDDCDAQCRRPHVVGTGTQQSCTEAELNAALAERSVRFNCGPDPVTITLTSEKVITAGTTIDGGGRITLNGGGTVRIFAVSGNAGLDLRNLTIADGLSGQGGGISNAGTLTLTNCTLSGNSAGIGGGIFNVGTLTLTNCTLSGNYSANDGGGIHNSGTLTLTNCTLSGNSATYAGGGIQSHGNCHFPGICTPCGSVIITNSTFSGNSANAGAGGIDGPCPVSVANSIIAGSSGANCGFAEGIIDGGHNLQSPGASCGETIPSLDPLLDPAGLQDNGGPTQTIAPLPGSPAINAGDPDVCANPPVNGVDQRGYARPGSGHTQCSIGAYEADAVSPEPCVGDCNGTGSTTVDELITLVNIALGTVQAPACPHGVPSGAAVDVALILQAVNKALNGCGSAAPATR